MLKQKKYKYIVLNIIYIMLHEKLDVGVTSDKLIKRIKKKFDSLKIAKMLKLRRFYLKPYERRKQEKEKSLFRQHLRNKQQ